MCELNPKHELYFRLEAFTSNPDETKEQFEQEVAKRVFEAELALNKDGCYRFHIHGAEPSMTKEDIEILDTAFHMIHGPKMDGPRDEFERNFLDLIERLRTDADTATKAVIDDLFDRSDWPPEKLRGPASIDKHGADFGDDWT